MKDKNRWMAKEIILSALFAALMVIGGRISFPLAFYPVAFSLQTLVVMLAGLLLSPRSAAFSMAAYVLMGLIGLPVFTTGGGPSYVFQPSFGYLLGFILAAPIISSIVHKNDSVPFLIFATTVGTLIISVLGIAYFAIINVAFLSQTLSFQQLMGMFTITLPLDIVKMIMAIMLAVPMRRRLPLAVSG